jgi:hypothetical protein
MVSPQPEELPAVIREEVEDFNRRFMEPLISGNGSEAG